MTSGCDTIPKKLFFIWLGNRVPKYAATSMQAFQKVNPDFEVILVHRTTKQLENIWTSESLSDTYDIALKKALKRVLLEEDSYTTWQKNFYGPNPSFLQLLSDVARVEILNMHGGIYVDCDTFPICKFDSQLLARDFFAVKRKSNGKYVLDNFFLGKKKDEMKIVVDPYNVPDATFVDHTMPQSAVLIYHLLRKKFFDGTLKVDEHALTQDCYIDHYNTRTWSTGAVSPRQPPEWFDAIWKR